MVPTAGRQFVSSPIFGSSKDDPGSGSQSDTLQRVDKPRMFKVLLHNDDYTSMEFVVEVLTTVFQKTKVEATRVMLLVHQTGKGVAGIYTREVAEARVARTLSLAQSVGYPLLATAEPE